MAVNTKTLLSYAIVIFVVAAISVAGTYYYVTTVYTPPGEYGGTVLKAAWIYVGPVGDVGWTHAHDQGRLYVDNKFPWLETLGVESVDAADLRSVIDSLVAKGYKLIFTTSFDFMQGTYEAAEAYPDVIFFHCSGYMRRPNMGTYFAEFYQLYYLNGLMAGALTKTGKLGYIAAHFIPEVVRHINAFAIGANEIAKYLGKNVTIYVRKIGEWYAPDTAKAIAKDLVENYDVDTLAFTEDSAATVQYAEEYYETTENQIYVFSHYSPMYEYGPNVTVSGQLVHWEKIYEDIVTKVRLGVYNTTNLENVDYWWMLKEGAVELGADFGMPINPKFLDDLKAIKFTPDEKLKAELEACNMTDRIDEDGKISVYDLIELRLAQMKEEVPTFDPFTGPIYDNEGNLRVPEGVRMNREQLWTINWFVENVVVQTTS